MGRWIDRRRRLRLARLAKGLCPRCGEGRAVFPESSCKVCRGQVAQRRRKSKRRELERAGQGRLF